MQVPSFNSKIHTFCIIFHYFLFQKTFQVHQDSNRCVQCIVNCGQGVWIASQQMAKVFLYHATTYEFLLEVSIASAVSQKLLCKCFSLIHVHKTVHEQIPLFLSHWQVVQEAGDWAFGKLYCISLVKSVLYFSCEICTVFLC